MIRNIGGSNLGDLRLMNLDNTLRKTEQRALTRDGINFNTQQGRRGINDAFQTKIMELEEELRTTDFLTWTDSTDRQDES